MFFTRRSVLISLLFKKL